MASRKRSPGAIKGQPVEYPCMNVRAATEADVSAIRAVAEAAWRADYPDAIEKSTIEAGVGHWYGAAVVEMELSSPATILLVAERDGDVVGFVHAYGSGRHPTILRLHVAPAHRDSGAMAALFEAVETQVEEPEALRATALEANDHVQAFYADRGLERVDTESTTIGDAQYSEAVLARA